MPGLGQDGVDRVAVQPAGAYLAAQLLRRLLGESETVRPRLGHGLIGVGGGQDAGGGREHLTTSGARWQPEPSIRS